MAQVARFPDGDRRHGAHRTDCSVGGSTRRASNMDLMMQPPTPVPILPPIPAQPSVVVPIYPRVEGGKFAPGNPGKPHGAKSRVTRQRYRDVESLWPAALDALRERLAANDIQAVALVVKALMPSRGRPVELGEEITPQSIQAALADGELSASEAAQYATTLRALKEVTDLEALATRLEALEAALRAA